MRPLSDEQKRQILLLNGRGLSQVEIGKVVGCSNASVNNVLKAAGMRPKSASPAAVLPAPVAPMPPAAESEDDLPDEIPEGADASIAEAWLPRIQRAAAKAEATGNLAAFASLTAKMVAMLDHIRKSKPVPKPDPNDNPDMIAAKERARKELHRLIDHSLITRVRNA